jgi:hypothetical protein
MKAKCPCVLAAAFLLLTGPTPTEAKKPRPAPIRPISYGVFWTPDAASIFGGNAGMRALAAVEIRDKIRSALANSGLLAAQGYDIALTSFPGVVRDDIAPGAAGGSCDLDQIRAQFRLSPAVQQVRRIKKLSIMTLLVHCHDVAGRFAVGLTPTRAQDFKDPGTGFVVIQAGALDQPTNLTGVHEFAHTFGGCHPEGCGSADKRSPSAKPSAYSYALGIYLARVHPDDPRESDALGIGSVQRQLFFSHPGRNEFGRSTGDKNHDATRAIRENWTQVYGLASLP